MTSFLVILLEIFSQFIFLFDLSFVINFHTVKISSCDIEQEKPVDTHNFVFISQCL